MDVDLVCTPGPLIAVRNRLPGVEYEYESPPPTKSPASLVIVNVADCTSCDGEVAPVVPVKINVTASANAVMARADRARCSSIAAERKFMCPPISAV
jgi:hypothetical protein